MRYAIPLAALALAGCGELSIGTADLIGAAERSTELLIAAEERGVVIDGDLTREEWPGYLGAVAEVFGTDVPPEWKALTVQVCMASYAVGTEYDLEAQAVCDELTGI